MNAPKLWSLTAKVLAAGYRAGAFDPVDATEAVHGRIDAVNARITAVIAEDRDAALQAARASAGRWRTGRPLGPLDGVPITVKDNLFIAGLPATWGSPLHAEDRAEEDEPALERLRASGAVILGKTNIPEFTLQGYTDNTLHGPSRNPHAPDLTPGGSTGGGAAAVASGIGPIAIGTDGGGSTRRPAAHCDLWGFKPSLGHASRRGGFPQILSDFEVIGAMARSPADLRVTIAALGDRPFAEADAFDTPLRVGLFTEVGHHPVEPAIATAVSDFAERLRDDMADVERIAAPDDPDLLNTAFGRIAQAGLAWHLRNAGNGARPVMPGLAEMAEAGSAMAATDLYDAIATCHRFRWSMVPMFDRYDVLLCPTVAALAWPAREIFPASIAGREANARGHALFTTWVNIAGLPAVSVPLLRTPAAGGIAAQLIAGPGRDAALLRLMTGHPAFADVSACTIAEKIE